MKVCKGARAQGCEGKKDTVVGGHKGLYPFTCSTSRPTSHLVKLSLPDITSVN